MKHGFTPVVQDVKLHKLERHRQDTLNRAE